MRNDYFDRRTGLNREDTNKGAMMLGLIAVIAIAGALFLWASHGASTPDNSSAGTSVGSSSARPAAPSLPTAPGPTTTR